MATEAEKSSGDDARVRDHLANERTYLAWMRTGVSTMGLGVVIAKLKYILGPSYPQSGGAIHAANIGILFAYVGVATIGMSVFFFFSTRKQIRDSAYVSGGIFVIILAALMIALGLIILWYLSEPMM
jgi:putative membrane protein